VAGGLLVAVAMVLAFSLSSQPGADRPDRVVVARHDLRIGTRITPDDVTVVAAALPASARPTTFARTDDLVGTVTDAPIAAGQIVDRAEIAPGDRADRGAQLSFPVDRARALDGDLQTGDRVDLLATYGTGDGARTLRVARAVRLVAVDEGDHGDLASGGKLVVTVELGPDDDVLRVAHASEVAALSVVRSTGSSAGADSYSLPPDGDGQAPP
jgi:Flp pilus assembly protein CpaB